MTVLLLLSSSLAGKEKCDNKGGEEEDEEPETAAQPRPAAQTDGRTVDRRRVHVDGVVLRLDRVQRRPRPAGAPARVPGAAPAALARPRRLAAHTRPPLLLAHTRRWHYAALFPWPWYEEDSVGGARVLRHPLGLVLGLSTVVLGHTCLLVYALLHLREHLGPITPI